MLTTVEGIYKQGQIKLNEMPVGIEETRVLITFLPVETRMPSQRRMFYGQFAGERMSTEEDFRIAEWRGEIRDHDGD